MIYNSESNKKIIYNKKSSTTSSKLLYLNQKIKLKKIHLVTYWNCLKKRSYSSLEIDNQQNYILVPMTFASEYLL